MRKILFYLLILCVTTSAFGQNLVLSPNPVEVTGDANTIAEAHAELTNNGPETQVLTWKRTINSITSGWESSICDPNLCWAPFADAPSYGFSLTSGGTGTVYAKFDATNAPDGPAIPGTGHVEVLFYSIADSANYNATAVFHAMLTGDVGFFSPNAENSFTLYPNPAVSDINLLASYTSNISQINIVNIVGKVVSSSAWTTTSGIMTMNISSLPEGIYFVQFMNAKNEIVATKKLAVKD
ncbi:MAG: T9SS type A sorting domain-containing protein [Chitinophagales bacterium]